MPVAIGWLIVGMVFLIALIKIIYENRIGLQAESNITTYSDNPTEYDDDGDEEGDEGEVEQEILTAIAAAQNGRRLMAVAKEMDYDDKVLYAEENDAFLQKALLFEADLDEDDWDLIYHVAGEDSQLEQEAEKRREGED